ncbi:hypothetical protein CC86DRAFT_426528 [Ophiobolus disseminans]|uniref:Uncharacterized protein n=1 Tax=Ophiobolus disseminans TaxID=1469910 RepID=A0A6A6ZJL6_9PLEO|nr:hypothetical protein CC86DRAFT_426528 [Ophiobolus disseminans]
MALYAYITVRTQSHRPEKPGLIVDYLPLQGIGAVRRINTVTHRWDDSEPLATPKGRAIKLGAGIPNTPFTSVGVHDQGWEEDLMDMRGRLMENLATEMMGAMSGREVVMEWTAPGDGVHPLGHVREGDDHFWWEIRSVEVAIDRSAPPSMAMYR